MLSASTQPRQSSLQASLEREGREILARRLLRVFSCEDLRRREVSLDECLEAACKFTVITLLSVRDNIKVWTGGQNTVLRKTQTANTGQLVQSKKFFRTPRRRE